MQLLTNTPGWGNTAAISVQGNPQYLAKNLAALAHRSPNVAKAVSHAKCDSNRFEFFESRDGSLCIRMNHLGKRTLLCSAVDPQAEAQLLLQRVDVLEAAAIVVRGFGAGHHVQAIAQRIGRQGAVFVFEPDIELLRGVLERVDITSWLSTSPVTFMTDAGDGSAMASAVQGLEGLVAIGTQIVDHPPSRLRLSTDAGAFIEGFTHIIKSVRTNIITTLMHADVTVRNCIQNIGPYAMSQGVADLVGVGSGKPAVIVSAGPSLAKNMHLLAQPGMRDKVIIIAVQTVLKQLLSAGIKPHFVTALDYHEISARFYEGLSSEDVEGITLVAECKCNPAIVRAYPGKIRFVGDDVPDRILGEKLYQNRGRIQPGSTVAHLAYYLGRHMGCDPVMLIGQDLGFTNGQYYGPGAAIHQTWACELSEFNTLEMLEWQRIARMRHLLRPAKDQHGRKAYTDEQMATYLVQFERDFARDQAKGLITIDATEGGLTKNHTKVMTLRDALDAYAHKSGTWNGDTQGSLIPSSRNACIERLRDLQQHIKRIKQLATNTQGDLQAMLGCLGDERTLNLLIDKAQKAAAEASGAGQEAHWLVQFINQTGQLKRFRADRKLELAIDQTPQEKQRGQIERDIENVRWLADAAEYLGNLVEDGIATLNGKAPVTRDPTFARAERCTDLDSKPGERDSVTVTSSTQQVHACIHVPATADLEPTRTLLARLESAKSLDGILLLCEREEEARALRGHTLTQKIQVHTLTQTQTRLCTTRREKMLAARGWSKHCWRGGIANTSMYDEVFFARGLYEEMAQRGIDAAVVIGHDWAMTDMGLTASVIERYRERPDSHGLTFTQAPPGLCGLLVSQTLVRELAHASGAFATLGGLLGYIPVAPQSDPISKPVCPPIPHTVRDAMLRFVPDSPWRRELWHRSLSASCVEEVVSLWQRELHGDNVRRSIETVTLHLDAKTDECGIELALTSLYREGKTADHDSFAITAHVHGKIEPMKLRGLLARIIEHSTGPLHVRSTLLGGEDEANELLACRAQVISVDRYSQREETFTQLVNAIELGLDLQGSFDATRRGFSILEKANSTNEDDGLPARWLVPRFMRCDQVYEYLEELYTMHLMNHGACVIDPPASTVPCEHITPFPLPACVRHHHAQTHVDFDLRGMRTQQLKSQTSAGQHSGGGGFTS